MNHQCKPVQNIILAIAVAAALQPAAVWAGASSTIPTYQAGTGALSYMFFNLSGSNCTLTAYGSGGNPAAYSTSWAQVVGWGNNDAANAGFFNNYGLGGDEKNPSSQVSNNYLFYNNADPINSSSVPTSAITLDVGQGGENSGKTSNVVITSSQLGPNSDNYSINYPAMGDSWGIACYGQNTIALANLASAASALQSNGPTSYPYNQSMTGWFYNSTINPPAWAGCNAQGNASYTNPCGVGFTSANASAGNQILNWNVATTAANYQAMGGLWSGVNYNYNNSSSTYPAANLLNMPMLPINFSAYQQASQGNSNPNDSSQSMNYTDVYGGHFTLAMGDPFVISSYAAKMLWFAVMNATLNDDTNLSSISSALSKTAGTGVFSEGSYEDNYVQWLLGSQSASQNYAGAPQLAANAYQSAFKAASVPVTKESFWGKFFTGLADAALDAGVAALTFVPGGDVVVAASVGAATAVTGAVIPDMNAAIGNSFTSTLSANPPLSQNAPVVINPSYAANNLLGLFLTNTAVQSAINSTLSVSSPPNPFWSNYSIYTDNQSSNTTGCANISMANSLMNGTCYPSGGGSGVVNGSQGSVPSGTYTNVYAANPTTTEFSLWNAILTGSDVTTDGNGYIVMGNSSGSISSFSPPVQMINATNGSSAPTTALPSGLAVNTTFNLNTGTLTAQSYVNGTMPSGGNPPPSAAPTPTDVVSGSNPYNVVYSWATESYNSSTGIFSATAYWASVGGNQNFYAFANGTPTLDMTNCLVNSAVTLTITPDPSSPTGANASGALSCLGIQTLSNVTLSYQSCVNDPWATGGVVAAFTTAPSSSTGEGGAVTLACACVPSYLDGPSTSTAGANVLGGVVVGATSASPTQTCAVP
ncbi:MAG: hypothetical protein ACKN9W_03075 [Methylococcus sp.]